jgi:hypothetical protein
LTERAVAVPRAQAGEQGRAGQGRAGQGRAGQGRAGQGRAGQGRAGQGRAGQGRAGQGRAGEGRAGQGRAGQGRAGQASERAGADTAWAQARAQHAGRALSRLTDGQLQGHGQHLLQVGHALAAVATAALRAATRSCWELGGGVLLGGACQRPGAGCVHGGGWYRLVGMAVVAPLHVYHDAPPLKLLPHSWPLTTHHAPLPAHPPSS